jgi:hypothetical protein
VHEEKEAGSDAIYFLVKADPDAYFDRYLEFLRSIDLEHTLAQHDNTRMLVDHLSSEQVDELKKLLAETSGGEYFAL